MTTPIPHQEATVILHEIARLIRRRLEERISDLGLSEAQWRVIGFLSIGAGMSQTALAELLGMQKAPLGEILDRLEKKQWVYVTDRSRGGVVVYDSIGLYQKFIDLNEHTTQLAGITVSDSGDRIYVVDRGGLDSDKHQVIVLDQQGEIVNKIGARGSKKGEFNFPLDVALASNGILYILDSGNFRVQAFNQEGEYLYQWGQAGKSFGQFSRPRSITIDAENNLYVGDAEFGNVQVFNNEGKLLIPLGQLSREAKPGHFTLLTGVEVDEKDFLYILDQFQNKMEVYKKLSDDEGKQLLLEIKSQEETED